MPSLYRSQNFLRNTLRSEELGVRRKEKEEQEIHFLTPDYLRLTFHFWIEHGLEKCAQAFQDLNRNLMTTLKVNPADG